MKSHTKIETQTQRKKSKSLVDTIILAKKNKNWIKVSEILSSPRRNKINMNISDINKVAKEGKTVVLPGKILSQGEINKKINIVALNFSDKAKEKLLKAGCKVSSIVEEIKKNPEAKGIEIIKNG